MSEDAPTREELERLVSEGPIVPPPPVQKPQEGVYISSRESPPAPSTVRVVGQVQRRSPLDIGDQVKQPCGLRCTARCDILARPFCAGLNERQRQVLLHAPGLMVREAFQLRNIEADKVRIAQEQLLAAQQRASTLADDLKAATLEVQIARGRVVALRRWTYGLIGLLAAALLYAIAR